MYTLALPAPQITVPKFRLNNNLLRLISVILLCVMVFLAVEAIAQVCQSERNALNVALAWQAAALVAVITAEGGFSRCDRVWKPDCDCGCGRFSLGCGGGVGCGDASSHCC